MILEINFLQSLFLLQLIASVLAAATALSVVEQASLLKGAETVQQKEPLSCLDYAYSFICCPKSFNSVRFWIESRTILIDEKNNQQTAIYQCASCKSENTFGKSDLFLSPNYDFMPIFQLVFTPWFSYLGKV